MRRRSRMRTAGRIIAALAAVGFACAAYIYLTLPDVRVLRTQNPPTTAFIELRASQAIAKGEQPRRVQRWVNYARISPSLTRAVIVTEDSAFWEHGGVDYQQLKESMEVNLERMEFARGASTITQQLAKNLYLSPSKNPVRKGRELLIARRLEAELSKVRILELYLNLIEWGNGIYGAEAAARTYFGKSAAGLGPQESALLAGAIINPRLLDPGRPTARLRRRQEMILRRLGAVTLPPVVAEPLTPVPLPDTGEIPGPALPIEAPLVLPGEVVPPSKPPVPGGKPPGPPGTPPGAQLVPTNSAVTPFVWLTLTAPPLVSIVAIHSIRAPQSPLFAGSSIDAEGRGTGEPVPPASGIVCPDDQLHRAYLAPDAGHRPPHHKSFLY